MSSTANFQQSTSAQGYVTQKWMIQSSWNLNFMLVLDTCKFGEDPIKNDREKVETLFSSLLVNGSFDPICPKPNAAVPSLHWCYT